MTTSFVYDDDCGFCGRFAGFIRRRVRPSRLEVVPSSIAAQRFGALAYGDSAFLVEQDGTVHDRAAAIGGALTAVGGAWRPVGAVIASRRMRPLANRAYSVVARNRRLLGCGGTCSI